jgi:2-dehydro-3-deoxygalactonokinase
MQPADVMRGEETQLAGLLAKLGLDQATACTPGTHSKWVQLDGGRVTSFVTFMTGEMFAVTAEHSILRHTIAGDGFDEEAFRSAVEQMLEAPQQLTSALFSIRATSLLEGLGSEAARSRLSGLLIGFELAATRSRWEGRTVHLVGANTLAVRYAAALEFAGGLVARHDVETLTRAGLSQVRKLMREEAG